MNDTGTEPSSPREFVDANLRGARFIRCDLSGSVMRAVDVSGLDIDAPWLLDGESALLINGVDVAPLVDAELNRRFPGRESRRATEPDTLSEAWQQCQASWNLALARVAAMPPDTVEISVNGEWSFAQTLRHLVMATDVWLRRTVLNVPNPLHPIGQPHAEYAADGYDMSVFSATAPTFAEVLTVRADRVAMVRDFIATVTPEQLDEIHPSPWNPQHSESTLACLQVILEEEWEHLRFALRDLDAIDARR